MFDTKKDSAESHLATRAAADSTHKLAEFDEKPSTFEAQQPLNLPAMHPLAFMRLGDSSFFDRIREKLRRLRERPVHEPINGDHDHNDGHNESLPLSDKKHAKDAQNSMENIAQDLSNDTMPPFLRMFTRLIPVKLIKVIKVDTKASKVPGVDSPVLSTDVNEKVFRLADGHVKKISEHTFHNEQKSAAISENHTMSQLHDELVRKNNAVMRKIRQKNLAAKTAHHSANHNEDSIDDESCEDSHSTSHGADKHKQLPHHKPKGSKHAHGCRLSFFASCKSTVNRYIADYATPQNAGYGAAALASLLLLLYVVMRVVKKFKARRDEEKPFFEYRSIRNQAAGEEVTSGSTNYKPLASYSHLAASSVFLAEDHDGAFNSV